MPVAERMRGRASMSLTPIISKRFSRNMDGRATGWSARTVIGMHGSWLLRDQLETYVAKERGGEYLALVEVKTELRAIRKERRGLEQRLGDSASCELREREAALQDLLPQAS